MSQLTTKIVGLYEAIERISGEMLTAAMANNWDEVVRLTNICMTLIHQIREASGLQPIQHHSSLTPIDDIAMRFRSTDGIAFDLAEFLSDSSKLPSGPHELH